MAKTKQEKIVSKKHLARQEREALQTRNIIIVSLVVIGSIVALIGGGILNQYVIQPNRAVAEVNGDKISVTEFQARVRYQRDNIIRYYESLAPYFGDTETLQQQLQQQLSDSTGIGQGVLDQLIEDRLVRQEAKRRNITISQAEIDKAIQGAFGFYPDGQPTPTATAEMRATSTLSVLQETLVAPTATEVPTMTLPTATATPTLVPSPTASLDITPTATSTPYTQDAFQENYKERLNSFKNDVGISEKAFRRIIESTLYREKALDAVVAEMNLPVEEERVWARQILVTDPITATLVMVSLQSGSDFAALAQQYSEDTQTSYTGGDMGWLGKDKLPTEVRDAIWNLQVGEVVSQPVQSQGNYYIVQILGHEIRPLNNGEYQQLRETKFQEWLAEQRKQAETALTLIIHDLWISVIPSTP